MAVSLAVLLEGLLDIDVPVATISSVATDSRDVVPGGLFLALAGYGGRHGLCYAEQAAASGAIAILWEPAENAIEPPSLDAVFIVAVPNLAMAVGVIAARFYQRPSQKLNVVGITGTDGKTSCAWMLAQAWNALGQRAGLVGTLGKGAMGSLERGAFTTPFPVELQSAYAAALSAGTTHMAVEVSSHALDQGRTVGTEFDVAVLTNLTRDHLDYHGTVEAYAAAKEKLFSDYAAPHWVVNTDDAFGQALVTKSTSQQQVWSYGTGDAVVSASGIEIWPSLQFRLSFQNQTWSVRTQLLGDFNVYNVLAVAAVLLAQGVAIEHVVPALEQISSPPGRLELMRSTTGATVVVDYAHTPGALKSTLESLRHQDAGRVHCVFGCGGDRDRGKRPLMAEAAERNADVLWVTSDNPRTEEQQQIFDDIRAGLQKPGNVTFEQDRARAIQVAIAGLDKGDILLVAGKGHEDYQLIGDQRLPFSDREVVAEALGLPKPRGLYAN